MTSSRRTTGPQYSGGGGNLGRRGSHDDIRVQFEEVKERNRVLRSQLQVGVAVGVVINY